MNQPMQLFFATVLIASLSKTASFVLSDCTFPFDHRIGNYNVECFNIDGYNVQIHCYGNPLSNLPEIKINLPSVSYIAFINCTFSKTVNMQSILSTMNVIYDRICFLNFDNTTDRLNFQNFSTSHLSLSNSNVNELPYDLFYEVQKVHLLKIYHTKLVHIPKAFFSRWAEKLLEVHLYDNKLRKIAKNDLNPLVDVVKLDLSLNEIGEIELGSFDKLVHLELLNLTSNQLHILPSDIFRQLTRLTTLVLSSAFISKSTRDPSADPKNLTMLNHRKKLGANQFERAFNTISEVEDSQNLPFGLFDGNKNLVRLELDSNGLKTLPVGIFKELKKLKYLYLFNNRLTTLEPDIFMRSHTFEYLNASTSPSINILENQNFQQLIVMNLSFNSFTEINGGFMSILKHSRKVDFSNNHISKVNLTGLSLAITKLDHFNFNDSVEVYLGNNPLHCDCYLMDFIRYLNGSSFHEVRQSVTILDEKDVKFGDGFTCSSPSELRSRDIRKIHLKEFHCLWQSDNADDACNKTCVCQQYPGRHVLSLDCSRRNLTQLPEVIGNIRNWSIELNMSGNALQRTPSLNQSHLLNVTHLDLSSNNINEVSLSLFSQKLQHLKLHNNSIVRLDTNIIRFLVRDNLLRSLTLYNNKWICDCEIHEFFQSYARSKLSTDNFYEVLCYGSNRKLYEITTSELCEDTNIKIYCAGFSIAFFGIIISSLFALDYRYQKQIKIWLYSKNLCLWLFTEDQLDKDKKYDAFVSFSHKDENFVVNEIITKLEEEPHPYRLCLHYRDWLAGEWIHLQIKQSVAESRRTIIVLTPNFLESSWGLSEFRAAHSQMLEENRSRLIVILYGEIDNADDLDQELNDYLSMNTYIKWGDPRFWQKLKYALPHKSRNDKIVKTHDTVHYRITDDENAIVVENS